MNSPKHKFLAEINFNVPQAGVGSVTSFTANDIAQLQSYIKAMNYSNCHVVIKENKSQYPSFNWVLVKSYDIK